MNEQINDDVQKAIQRIRLLTPSEGSVILVTCDPELSMDTIESIFKQLNGYISPRDVLLLVTNENLEVAYADEYVMNQHGWYRKR